MSETNTVEVYYKKQSDRDTAVSSATTFETLGYTSSDLGGNPVVAPDGLIGTRQTRSVNVVDQENSGSIGIRMLNESMQEPFSGVFFNVWQRKASADVSDVTSVSSGSIDFDKDVGLFAGALIKISSSDSDLEGVYDVTAWDSSTYTATVTGIPSKASLPTRLDVKLIGKSYALSELTVDTTAKTLTFSEDLDVTLAKGEMIALTGLTNSQAGFYRISSVSSNVYTYDSFTNSDKFSSYTGSRIRVYFSDYLRDGNTKQYYTVVTNFSGANGPENKYQHEGAVFTELSLSFDPTDLISGSLSVLALKSAWNSNSYTFNDRQPDRALNASSNVGKILVNGEEITTVNAIQEASITINNNPREQKAVGVLGSFDVAVGECEVGGNLTTYLGDSSIAKDIVESNSSSLSLPIHDTLRNTAMFLDFPEIFYLSGFPDVPSSNDDVTVNSDFRAVLKSGLDYQVGAYYFPHF